MREVADQGSYQQMRATLLATQANPNRRELEAMKGTPLSRRLATAAREGTRVTPMYVSVTGQRVANTHWDRYAVFLNFYKAFTKYSTAEEGTGRYSDFSAYIHSPLIYPHLLRFSVEDLFTMYQPIASMERNEEWENRYGEIISLIDAAIESKRTLGAALANQSNNDNSYHPSVNNYNSNRNNGNGTFSDVSVAANMYDPVQTWSSAWADFDNDGDMDALVGASSTTDGSHKYMKNNGNGTFTDATAGTGWDTNTSTSIEHIAYDFDNNGFVDVMGGGNKIMYNQGNGTFVPFTHGFDVSAVGDLNNDGFLDFQSGTTLRISSGNSNKWLKLNLRGIQCNSNGIGARVEIYGSWGKQIRDVRSGEGFKYMSSLNVHFGIGSATNITQVIVRWPSGLVDTFNNVTPNQTLSVVEGATLETNSFENSVFTMYPNPVKNNITIAINTANPVEFTSAEIYDLTGRRVQVTAVLNQNIVVDALAAGTYILKLTDSNNKNYTQKFIKE
jgi:hypothetical protein